LTSLIPTIIEDIEPGKARTHLDPSLIETEKKTNSDDAPVPRKGDNVENSDAINATA
jgi:hypothetical protein